MLGIDPGTAIMGYGVVRVEGRRCTALDFGAIRTAKDRTRGERLRLIYDQLQALLARHQPDELACEQLFFSRNVSTAMAVGEARGVVLLCAAQQGVPFFEYTPTDVKQSLCGSGRGAKSEVGQMVAWNLELAEVPRPDDVADALAIALCHIYHGRLGDATSL